MSTLNQLKRREFSLAANRCPLCEKEDENIEHFLIHCPMVWGILTFLLAAMGVAWVPPLLVKDLIIGWNSIPLIIGWNSIPINKMKERPGKLLPLVCSGQSERKGIK